MERGCTEGGAVGDSRRNLVIPVLSTSGHSIGWKARIPIHPIATMEEITAANNMS